MAEQSKRLHPLKIPFEMWNVLKKEFFLIILLYVLNFGTEKIYMIALHFELAHLYISD